MTILFAFYMHLNQNSCYLYIHGICKIPFYIFYYIYIFILKTKVLKKGENTTKEWFTVIVH